MPVVDTIVIPAGDYLLNSPARYIRRREYRERTGVNPDQIQIAASSDEMNFNELEFDPGVTATIQGIDFAGSQFSSSVFFEPTVILNFGTLYLRDSEFEDNVANAISNLGNLIVNSCLFADNSSPLGLPAGIDNLGALTVVNSTFAGNEVVGNGAAIGNFPMATAAIASSTFIDNSADASDLGSASESGGGAIANGGDLFMSASTVAFNSGATAAGGIYSYGDFGETTLTGDIVVGNVSGSTSSQTADDIAGLAVQPASRDNLVGVDSTGSLQGGASGNLVNVSVAQAGLAPLNDYGGPTPTLALLPGSKALGTFGNGGALTTLAGNVINPTGTSVMVNNGSIFAASSLPTLATGSYFTIQIDNEQMAVTGLTA